METETKTKPKPTEEQAQRLGHAAMKAHEILMRELNDDVFHYMHTKGDPEFVCRIKLAMATGESINRFFDKLDAAAVEIFGKPPEMFEAPESSSPSNPDTDS